MRGAFDTDRDVLLSFLTGLPQTASSGAATVAALHEASMKTAGVVLEAGTLVATGIAGAAMFALPEYLDASPWLKITSAGALTLAGGLVTAVKGSISSRLARPRISLPLEPLPALSSIRVGVSADRPTLESVSLEFHFSAWIKHVSRSHTLGDARDLVFVEGEPATPYLTNRLEIRADGIRPGAILGYTIEGEDAPIPGVQFADRGLVRLTYTWRHKGGIESAEEWRSLKGGVEAAPPWARIGPVRMVGGLDEGRLETTVTPLRSGPPAVDQLIVFVPSDGALLPIQGSAPFGHVPRKALVP